MLTDLLIRLAVAGLLSGLIGFERQLRSKDAGLRTHILVGMGSAMFMIASKYGFSDILSQEHIALDPSRIAAQVVSGMGFLGAGTIMLQRNVVRGLTTAAGLWVTASIGLIIGSGLYEIGLYGTILTLLVLEAAIFFNHFLIGQSCNVLLKITNEQVPYLFDHLNRLKIKVSNINIESKIQQDSFSKISMELTFRPKQTIADVYQHLTHFNGVITVKMY